MPKPKDLKRYCENNGWELLRVTDHYFYVKKEEDGSIKRVKVSMGSKEISKNLWKDILKNKLGITQEEFNKGI